MFYVHIKNGITTTCKIPISSRRFLRKESCFVYRYCMYRYIRMVLTVLRKINLKDGGRKKCPNGRVIFKIPSWKNRRRRCTLVYDFCAISAPKPYVLCMYIKSIQESLNMYRHWGKDSVFLGVCEKSKFQILPFTHTYIYHSKAENERN